MALASILQDSKAIWREETEVVTCYQGADTKKGWHCALEGVSTLLESGPLCYYVEADL